MSSERFFNRDLSLLAFQRRVLAQAADPQAPLLERVRFLAIFSSNLDEFFMKRLGVLRRLLAKGASRAGADGASPSEILERVRREIAELFAERARLWREELQPALRRAGIEILDWAQLDEAAKARATAYFQSEVFPVLTPLAVDPAHPFPFLSNQSVSLGVKLRHPGRAESLFARLKIPDVLPQWVKVSGDGEASLRLARLQDVIQAHLPSFFPEMELEQVAGFRVLRSAEIEQVIEEADDLLEVVEEELRLRRMAEIVALQASGPADPWISRLLNEELDLEPSDLYESPGELNYLSLFEIAALPYPALRFEPWTPVPPPALAAEGAEFFRALRERDELVHLPFDSFQASVEKLLREASRDPAVLAVKIALYRLGENSPLVPLLIEAALAGKQVVCVVELKARFDEARNIYWSEQLEKAGVHVVYGVVGLKTHAKIALVVRRESGGYRVYGHVGTGNYNPGTAKLYTDFGLFSADPAVTSEMIEIFNYLTGLSLHKGYDAFLLAPVNMRARFIELIEGETLNARQGKPAHIVGKMNALEDPAIVDKLYEASQAGVKVDLVVRGLCCVRPGVPGLSGNIQVRSVVGRFLEHSRLYYFRRGAADPVDGDFYIGSSDWMTRNLNNRVETVAPIRARHNRQALWDIAGAYLNDETLTWRLLPDGSYTHLKTPASGPGVQEKMMALAKGA